MPPPEPANEAPTSNAVKAPKSSESTGKTPKETAQEWRTFEATAYVALCDTGCIGVTFTGIDVSHTVNYHGRRIVAVDQSVIPLGTELTIRLADGSEIEAIAMDTGGAIKGRKIDVLMPSEEAAWDFGRQAVKVKISKAGKAK
ncbi:3D domain-containing protein [Paenibacillus sp. FSL M7-1455]|uniref:3D domain-containing protein n=1 Tax=Paenibacillus sp. FSL M7-1455 TaxID=2975316 RepID=UPI0040409957